MMSIKLLLLTVLTLEFLVSCSGNYGERVGMIVPEEAAETLTVMDFEKVQSVDKLPLGWSHYTFFNIDPATYKLEGPIAEHRSFSCETKDSASMLLRQVEISIDDFPKLKWSWMVEQNVKVVKSELEKEGDDSAARFFLIFTDSDEKELMLELYWAPQYKAGQEKRIHEFYHYAVRGDGDILGQWYKESIDLKKITKKAFGNVNNLKLKVIGIFCDTDGSHSGSKALFSNVHMTRK